jgi:hypothetical protein
MLRASAQSNDTEIDIQGIAGDANSANEGIEYGAELMGFAEAVANHEPDSLPLARQKLLDKAGPEVLVDAAGVAANFQRMVRIADSIGIPYDNSRSDMSAQIQEDLNLNAFASAQNTFAAMAARK